MHPDKYRPEYHFTPPANWLNDPNGLVYFDGEFHLFYQHYPYAIHWGAMHWGHAVSKDLMHWEHLPVALFPDKHGTVFSGSIVADNENSSGFGDGINEPLVAVFTHFKYGLQRQSIACSIDKGRSWQKYPGNPVIKNPLRIHFRDPKVFIYKPSKLWVMVLSCGNHIRFYHSPDLKKWKPAGQFGRHDGAHGSVWECPDLFEMEVVNEPGVKKWVMLVSVKEKAPSGGSGTQYFTGDFNGNEFVNDNPPVKVLWLDYGKDNYAGVTWNNIPETDGRRIFTAWMNNWEYARVLPTTPWRGAMTIPRELSLYKTGNEYLLASVPVKEFEAFRKKKMGEENICTYNDFIITRPDEVKGNSFEIETVMNTGNNPEFFFEFKDTMGTPLLLSLNIKKRTLNFTRKSPGGITFSRKFDGDFISPVILNSDKIKIHILIDNCSAEIFINDGLTCMTGLFFPAGRIDKIIISSSAKPYMIDYLNYNEINAK